MTLAAVAAFAPRASAQVTVTGAVKAKTAVDAATLAALPRVTETVRVAAAGGAYRGTFEVGGVPLIALLQRAGVEKQVDDGFNRPIDLLVVVKGRGGTEALFSIGELEFGGDGRRIVLADRVRLVMPHHHAEVPPLAPPDGWLDGPRRAALKVPESCSGCHRESKAPAIDLPAGTILAAAADRWPARFVDDIVEVSVRQVGVAVPAARKKGARPGPAVTLVRLDGGAVPLDAAALALLGETSLTDATFGQGRGFHGIHSWTGVSLARVIAAHLPAGTDLARVWVLVTAADGYRTVLSGTEVFARPDNAVLATREDGAPLGEVGPMRLVVRDDFYVDRSVHSVQEIRLGSL